MALQWLARIFGISPTDKQQELSSLILQGNDNNESSFLEQKKGLRRLSLAQRQQGEAVDQLTLQISALSADLNKSHDVSFDYPQILTLLDALEKIGLASSDDKSISRLCEQAVDAVLTPTGLQAVAHYHAPYPDNACEVVAAVPDSQQSPGTVREIIQQGYRRRDGSLLRAAKVVVWVSPPPLPSSTTNNEEPDNGI